MTEKKGSACNACVMSPRTPPGPPAPWYARRMYSRLFRLVGIIICGLAVLTLGVLAFVLPKPTVSETEKRELTPWPAFSWDALYTGEYMAQIERHYADTFPFRDALLGYANRTESLRGLRPDEVRIVVPDSPQTLQTEAAGSVTDGTKPDTQTPPDLPGDSGVPKGDEPGGSDAPGKEPEDDTAPPDKVPEEEEPVFALERSGPVFIYGNMAFEIFGGSSAQTAQYAAAVSQYSEVLGSGVKVYNMVVPSSIAFNLPAKYADSSKPQKPNIEGIYAAFAPDIISVDAYSALEDHSDEYIYFNTDHHWTGLGAYYAYRAFAGAAGFVPRAYNSYDLGKIEGFVGSLFSATGDERLKNNPDTVEYARIPVQIESYLYEKKAQTTPVKAAPLAEYAKGINSYSVYLHGDYPRFDIKNLDNPGGGSIMVIKESYGNAFAPYLIPHYENVYVIDMRYFKGNVAELVREKGISEVLIIDNIFAANTKSFSQRLQALLTQ